MASSTVSPITLISLSAGAADGAAEGAGAAVGRFLAMRSVSTGFARSENFTFTLFPEQLTSASFFSGRIFATNPCAPRVFITTFAPGTISLSEISSVRTLSVVSPPSYARDSNRLRSLFALRSARSSASLSSCFICSTISLALSTALFTRRFVSALAFALMRSSASFTFFSLSSIFASLPDAARRSSSAAFSSPSALDFMAKA